MAKLAIERYGDESAAAALDSIVPQLESLIGRLEALMTIAEERKSLIGASNLAREIRQSLELVARIRHELEDRPQNVTVNVLATPEFVQAVAVIMEELGPLPDVRVRIADRLAALSGALPVLDVEEVA
jgi:hypothetical protein